jgi:hypothetical protein
MKKEETMLTKFADKLMDKFMALNPAGKPVRWCIKLISPDEEYKNAALLHLSADVGLLCSPSHIHEAITKEAVFDFFDTEDGYYLFALIQSEFVEKVKCYCKYNCPKCGRFLKKTESDGLWCTNECYKSEDALWIAFEKRELAIWRSRGQV